MHVLYFFSLTINLLLVIILLNLFHTYKNNTSAQKQQILHYTVNLTFLYIRNDVSLTVLGKLLF